MFKNGKITKEQLDSMIDQTSMMKNYFANLEPCIEISKNTIGLFPFTEKAIEHLDTMQEQTNIYKQYFTMTETYLRMINSNLDLWHHLYILPKKA